MCSSYFVEKEKSEQVKEMSNTEATNKLSAELSQLFKNNSDCYADTRIDDGYNMFEGEVIQAMTEVKFIKLAESFASMRVEQEKESIRQFLISEGFEMLAEKI